MPTVETKDQRITCFSGNEVKVVMYQRYGNLVDMPTQDIADMAMKCLAMLRDRADLGDCGIWSPEGEYSFPYGFIIESHADALKKTIADMRYEEWDQIDERKAKAKKSATPKARAR